MTEKKPIHLENRTQTGARLFSPTAARNREPIADILADLMQQNAEVLEIASGTGEHALHMCQRRPDVIWQPSDPNAESRASQEVWASESDGRMLPSLDIDTSQPAWSEGLGPYDVLFCANMIHIAPWEAALGLATGAKTLIKPSGMVVLYGPFKEGENTAPSNLEFDASLKSRDPRWGVRDLISVKHIFAKIGFSNVQRIVMPKNNLILVFQRS